MSAPNFKLGSWSRGVEQIFELPHLTNLTIRGGDYNSFPKGLSKLQGLKKLVFYNTKNFKIPEEVFELQNLEELVFRHNPIEKISPEIVNCKKLKSLDLKSCIALKEFPETTLRSLSNLESIHFSNTPVAKECNTYRRRYL